MRHIDRLAEPGILTKKKAQWLSDFLDSGKNRPDSSKYGHKDILAALNNMSYNKCFYSEERLIAKPKNVDHLMEVALDKTKAFEWSNLYLSSPECNQGRPDNNNIPIADVLDPCKDSDAEIQAHITFDNELIQANNGSKKGLDTIRKFKLNNGSLIQKRCHCLRMLADFILSKNMTREAKGRVSLTDSEKNEIRAWASPDREFSLMVEVYLKKYNFM